MNSKKQLILLGLAILTLTLFSCAPNNEMYLEKPAGFWAGLWHGLIIVITFIIGLFTDTVRMYEVSNVGGWYDFGFLLGAMISLGQCGWHSRKTKKKSDKEKEWEEIGVRVEEKVRTGIQNWLDETEDKDQEWEEIGKKVEEKIKRELRNWAEK